MKWTKKKPKTEGWWWYKCLITDGVLPVLIEIDGNEDLFAHQIRQTVKESDLCLWSDSPIEEPEKEKQHP